MASSKARSRNRSGRPTRSGGARPAARTAAPKQQGQQGQAAKAPAAKPQGASAKPQAAGAQAEQPRETAHGGPGRAKRQATAVTAEPVAPARPAGPPIWLQFTTLALAIAGLGLSAYETYAHFNGSHLAGCPTGGNGTFNCTAVITSSQSMVFGVFPVAVLGLAFYVVVTALMTPWAWRIQRREVGLLRLVSMVAGMGFVMYLIYAEVVQIQDICEYCTGVHVITFLLFCIIVFSAAIWGLGKPAAKAKAA
ncbi:MAG TPA: vitamin K epoxide reductase family protein [Trebonia sp.]|nr:vitamin K epoxide reductase family protein [Trebonia sp.]